MCPSHLPNTDALRWILTTDHTALYHWVTVSRRDDAVNEKVYTGHTRTVRTLCLCPTCHMEPTSWEKRHEEGRGRDGERSRYHVKEGTRKLRRVDADKMQGEVQWARQEGKGSQTGEA